MPKINVINHYLQDRLNRENISEVSAVEAALWLHQAGLLGDSASRPGLPLRRLLRDGQISGQHQELNGRWYIRACGEEHHESTPQNEDGMVGIPIRRKLKAEQPHVLPDYLKDGLDILFVGTAASDVSAARKHYYSGYNNSFYKCIYQAGIVPVPLGPEDDWRLPEYGVGLTDLVKSRHTGDDSNLSQLELAGGASLLQKKILDFNPRIVCFNGKTAYAAFVGHGRHHYGLSEVSIGSSKVFIVPSTSGRVNGDTLLDGKTRLEWFEAIKWLRDTGQ